jgi:hypothetical protein
MPKPNPSDLSGAMAISGLLKEKPNQTVAEVAEGLAGRFPSARFHRTTARNVLPQMARSAHSRPFVRCTYRAAGTNRKLDRYELTRAGEDAFNAWMRGIPSGSLPTLREALYGRIELCTLADLPALIRIAREEALIARDLYSEASTKLKQLREDADEHSTSEGTGGEVYLREVRDVLLLISPKHWAARHAEMEEVRRYLEAIARKAGIKFTVPR